MKNFDAEKAMRLAKVAAEGDTKTTATDNIALVIGESLTRSHMSAYGYERQTTPWLDARIKEGNIIMADKAYAGAAVTHTALGLALTERSQYNGMNPKDALTLIEAAKSAGYKVIWISNQLNDTIAGLIAMEADKLYWLNGSKNDTYLRQKNSVFDGHIAAKLDDLEREEKDSTKVLYVVHLLGSHATYDCRYPEKFNKWDEKENLKNAYDNSVLYNDTVMKEVTERLMNKLNVGMTVYFSDHGEELERKFCHGTDFYYDNYKKYPSVRDVVRIPMYFMYSDRYKENHPEVIAGLNANKLKFFTNDMIYDTVLGIMRIGGSHYNAKQDFSSPQYGFDLKDLKTGNGKVLLKDTY
jgi:heptose-I-phosphate ethanolaminephosphotransferase